MATKPFGVGDRVRIVGSHPHSGESGTIARAFNSPSAPDLKWVVSTERTWSDAAVAESDIRHAGRLRTMPDQVQEMASALRAAVENRTAESAVLTRIVTGEPAPCACGHRKENHVSGRVECWASNNGRTRCPCEQYSAAEVPPPHMAESAETVNLSVTSSEIAAQQRVNAIRDSLAAARMGLVEYAGWPDLDANIFTVIDRRDSSSKCKFGSIEDLETFVASIPPLYIAESDDSGNVTVRPLETQLANAPVVQSGDKLVIGLDAREWGKDGKLRRLKELQGAIEEHLPGVDVLLICGAQSMAVYRPDDGHAAEAHIATSGASGHDGEPDDSSALTAATRALSDIRDATGTSTQAHHIARRALDEIGTHA